jgi:hypothetical protein
MIRRFAAKGSRKKKFANLSVFRRPLSKALKSRNIKHIPYFGNTVEWDGWALKM